MNFKRVILFSCFCWILSLIFFGKGMHSMAATATPAQTSSSKATATSAATATATPAPSAKPVSGAAVSDFAGAKKAIIAAYKKYESSVDVSAYNLNYETEYDSLSSMMSEIVNNTPYLFFTGSSYKVSRNTNTNIIVTITLSYADDYKKTDGSINTKKIKKDKKSIKSEVKSAMTIINKKMGKAEKALALHDYLVEKLAYTSSKDAYYYKKETGAFIYNTCNCQGYALAYKILLNKAGLNSIIVTSDEMDHEWNKIYIKGKWYNVDVSWDDAIDSISKEDQYGLVLHDNFLCSDDYFINNGHSDFEDENYPSDTKYDKKYWKNIKSRMYYVNKTWLYMGVKGICERPKLLKKKFSVKYNVDGDKFIQYTNNIYFFIYNNSLYQYDYATNVTTPLWKCDDHYGSDYELVQIKCSGKSLNYKVSNSSSYKSGSLQLTKSGKLA